MTRKPGCWLCLSNLEHVQHQTALEAEHAAFGLGGKPVPECPAPKAERRVEARAAASARRQHRRLADERAFCRGQA